MPRCVRHDYPRAGLKVSGRVRRGISVGPLTLRITAALNFNKRAVLAGKLYDAEQASTIKLRSGVRPNGKR
jgi:hypothetical protein